MTRPNRRTAFLVGFPFLLIAAGTTGALAAVQEPVDPEARKILQTTLDLHRERVADVDDYTVYQTMNGASVDATSGPLYFEKRTVDGFPRFVVIPPHVYRQEKLERAGLGAGGMPGPGGRTPGPGGAAPGASGDPSPSGRLPSGLPEGMPSLPEGLPGLPEGLPANPGQAARQGAGRLADRLGAGGLTGGGDPRQKLMQKGMQAALGALAGDGEEAAPEGLGPEMIAELALRSRIVGEESVDGAACWVLEATDLEGLDVVGAGNADAMRVRTLRMWIDQELYVSRRFVMEAEMRTDGGMQPVEMEARMSDFREVEGLVEPFRKVVSIKGMMDAMAAQDPARAREMEQALAKMEQMEEQLADMPPEQRRMVEAQMGPMLERMRGMREGGLDGMEMVMETEEILVNRGPPSVLGSGSVSIGAPVSLDVGEVVVQASSGPNPEDGRTLWTAQIMGGLDDGSRVIVQLLHRGELPASGATVATGGIAVRLPDGGEATLASGEDGIRLDVVSRTRRRLVAEFEFSGEGAVQGSGGEKPVRAPVQGRFEAPLQQIPSGTMP